MAVCKTESVNIDGLSYETDFINLPKNKIEYSDFDTLISSRRSIRNFKDKHVSDELLEQIIEAASFAPFGNGPEKRNITVVNGREKIEKSLLSNTG